MAPDGTAYASSPYLAAFLRMAREPNLLGAYEPGTWVAFSGDQIVAASPELDELHRVLAEAGERDPLIVPIMPEPFMGH